MLLRESFGGNAPTVSWCIGSSLHQRNRTQRVPTGLQTAACCWSSLKPREEGFRSVCGGVCVPVVCKEVVPGWV